MVLKINANITLGSLPGFHMVFICAYLLIQSPWQLRPVFYSPHVFHVPNVSHAMFFHFRPGVFVFSQCFPCFSIFPMFVFPIVPKNLVHFCSVRFFFPIGMCSPSCFPCFLLFPIIFHVVFVPMFPVFFQKRPKLFFICHFFPVLHYIFSMIFSLHVCFLYFFLQAVRKKYMLAQPPGDKPLLFLRNNAHIVYIYTYIYLTYIYICIL